MDTRAAAQRRLRRYRRGTLLAVAMTGLLLMVTGIPGTEAAQDMVVPETDTVGRAGQEVPSAPADPGIALDEATGTLRQLANEFAGILPKILIALLVLLVAAALVRGVRFALRRSIGHWEKAHAATAMSGVLIWLVAVGVALSVVAGDARALVGSVGLLGLALSWALQAPIESFAGWLLNSFKGYYRIGDRIAVGEVFGDVYRIDALTTTVWEAGGPEKPVHGAQPTGALITFPNSEILRANIVNLTRGFPYVWDEVTVGIGNESEIAYSLDVIQRIATRVVGPIMAQPVATYRSLLERENLAYEIADEPQVYLSPTESWLEVTVRYLVPARERRRWASQLHEEILTEIARAEQHPRIVPAYPVMRVDLSPTEDL